VETKSIFHLLSVPHQLEYLSLLNFHPKTIKIFTYELSGPSGHQSTSKLGETLCFKKNQNAANSKLFKNQKYKFWSSAKYLLLLSKSFLNASQISERKLASFMVKHTV
jgi:hypothetical protein